MTAMAPTRTEPDLSYLLDHTSHVLRTRMAAALGEIGLTARMHCVLVHAVGEERTQIQLAEIGDMDKTTMVVTIDALEKAAWRSGGRPPRTAGRGSSPSPSGARRSPRRANGSSTGCTATRWPPCPRPPATPCCTD